MLPPSKDILPTKKMKIDEDEFVATSKELSEDESSITEPTRKTPSKNKLEATPGCTNCSILKARVDELEKQLKKGKLPSTDKEKPKTPKQQESHKKKLLKKYGNAIPRKIKSGKIFRSFMGGGTGEIIVDDVLQPV
jgi:hypothetical protein